MREHIGVLHAPLLLASDFTVGKLKQLFITFDKLAAVHLDDFDFLKNRECSEHGYLIDNVDWLYDSGRLISLEDYMKDRLPAPLREKLDADWEFSRNSCRCETSLYSNMGIFRYDAEGIPFYCSRYYSYLLSLQDDVTAIPVIPGLDNVNRNQVEGNNYFEGCVIDVVIDSMPVPSDKTSWDDLEEFKNDPDTNYKFNKIAFWMRKIASKKMNRSEIKDEIEELLLDYDRHMRLYEMETRRSQFEAIVVSFVEVAENLVKIKWGNIAKGLFSLSKKNVQLMREEMKAPGSEIAYIIKARKHFGG